MKESNPYVTVTRNADHFTYLHKNTMTTPDTRCLGDLLNYASAVDAHQDRLHSGLCFLRDTLVLMADTGTEIPYRQITGISSILHSMAIEILQNIEDWHVERGIIEELLAKPEVTK